MKIEKQMKGEYAILSIEGEMNLYNVSNLKEALNEIIQKKEYNVILDMKHVVYIDSNAIGILYNARMKLNSAKKEMYLNNLSHELLDILRIMGLSFPAISLQEK